MAYHVSDACVGCGTCESSCPLGAISMNDGRAVVDAEKCADCGTCASQCSVDAIHQ